MPSWLASNDRSITAGLIELKAVTRFDETRASSNSERLVNLLHRAISIDELAPLTQRWQTTRHRTHAARWRGLASSFLVEGAFRATKRAVVADALARTAVLDAEAFTDGADAVASHCMLQFPADD